MEHVIIAAGITSAFWIAAYLIFGRKAAAFESSEILRITQAIDNLKEQSLQEYNTLTAEWEQLIAKGRLELTELSEGLQNIIKAVKAI